MSCVEVIGFNVVHTEHDSHPVVQHRFCIVQPAPTDGAISEFVDTRRIRDEHLDQYFKREDDSGGVNVTLQEEQKPIKAKNPLNFFRKAASEGRKRKFSD